MVRARPRQLSRDAPGRTQRFEPEPGKSGSPLRMWIGARCTYAWFGPENQQRPERAMNALLVTCMSIGAPLAALGLHELQVRLERWDYDRHAED